MRYTLVLSSFACSLAFTMPSSAVSTSSPTHRISRGPARDSTNVASSSAVLDEWTAGLVLPVNGNNRRGGHHKRLHHKRRGGGGGGGSATALAMSTSGGAVMEAPPKTTRTPLGVLASAWGSLGVMYILLNPMKRLLPVALLPFYAATSATPEAAHTLGLLGWGCYVAWVAFMAYAEGYKGFQTKFSPMVVARASTLESGPSAHGDGSLQSMLDWSFKAAVAPVYSMGLFHASKKRLCVSWGMVVGIGAIVALCKRAPLPARCVIDGGVVAGLGWGAAAVFAHFVKSLATGTPPPGVDPCLPPASTA